MNIYVFDLDETLCTWNKDYKKARPYKERIAQVNKLYEQGHTIIIDTARGSRTGIDWKPITERQLFRWGVKYHKLRIGLKIFGTHYIDDKAINVKDFFK